MNIEVALAGNTAEGALGLDPDKDYYVLVHAYGDVSKPAPVKSVPSENLIVSYVPNFPWNDRTEKSPFLKNTRPEKSLKACANWGKGKTVPWKSIAPLIRGDVFKPFRSAR